MEEYYWDSKIEYLSQTRGLYYNDDYIEFLVKSVWKIETPIHMIDFGCGYYLDVSWQLKSHLKHILRVSLWSIGKG